MKSVDASSAEYHAATNTVGQRLSAQPGAQTSMPALEGRIYIKLNNGHPHGMSIHDLQLQLRFEHDRRSIKIALENMVSDGLIERVGVNYRRKDVR